MSTLPPCDHDGCSKLSCSQPVPAAGSAWPEYDLATDPEANETMYLYYLEALANEETTCQHIADQLNARFGNNRTKDDVLSRLWIGN